MMALGVFGLSPIGDGASVRLVNQIAEGGESS